MSRTIASLLICLLAAASTHVQAQIKRADREFNADLKSIAEERISPILRLSPSPTPMQLNIRESWLTGK